MIRVATAFSGGLAAVEFALRYENINHEIVFACEWDKYARQQYLQFHNNPKTFYKDVQDLKANKYKNQIDLFVWGSPCQDLSLAGKRKGFNGEKSSLFREGARVQKEMMPKNFIFENVKGLLSSNKGADYKEVCKTFRDMGYHIHTTVMNTKDFGIPQNRERVFIIGFLDEKEYHSYKEPQSFKLEKRLKDLLEDEVDEKYFLSQKMIDGFLRHKERHQEKGNGFQFKTTDGNKVANCLSCGVGTRATDDYIQIKSATKKGYETATENDSINFTHPDSKTRRGRVGKGVAQTLDCACNQGVIATQIGNSKSYGNATNDKGIAFCLRASEPNGVIEKSNIRRLTPKECFRLQGVHDININLVVSDTQAYKIAGNAISVNVMQYLLKSLYKKESTKESLFDFM